MRAGPRTNLSDSRIDYKELGKINPEAARKAVLEYLKTNEANTTPERPPSWISTGT